jgi:hypothetical protein
LFEANAIFPLSRHSKDVECSDHGHAQHRKQKAEQGVYRKPGQGQLKSPADGRRVRRLPGALDSRAMANRCRPAEIGKAAYEIGPAGATGGEVMVTFTRSDELREAEFVGTDLSGARFVGADLSGVVMRGVDVQGADIDAPWLLERDSGSLFVNSVDVAPFVEAELNRRFPGRAGRRAGHPEGLRAAWAALEQAWAATLARAAAMPAGAVDVSVRGEWSFAQTLRHLILATDAWLGRAVLGIEHPFHPIGLLYTSAAEDGLDMPVFTTVTPSYAEVLEVRAGRITMVRDFLAGVTPGELSTKRSSPWGESRYPQTTLSCLHVILEEEWEHLRYAVRDLDAIEAERAG